MPAGLAEPPHGARGRKENVVAGGGVGRPGEADGRQQLDLVSVKVDDTELALKGWGHPQGADGAAHDTPAVGDKDVPVGIEADPHP